MSDSKIQIKMLGIDAVESARQLEQMKSLYRIAIGRRPPEWMFSNSLSGIERSIDLMESSIALAGHRGSQSDYCDRLAIGCRELRRRCGEQSGLPVARVIAECAFIGEIKKTECAKLRELCPSFGSEIKGLRDKGSIDQLIERILCFVDREPWPQWENGPKPRLKPSVYDDEIEGPKINQASPALCQADNRRPCTRFDIEKIAVVLIAIFVAVIAVNHFRLVNARIEAARPCADQRR